MADLPPPLREPLATPLGLLGWRPRTDADRGLVRALFAALRRTELGLIGGDADQQAAFVDLQLRARDHQREALFPGARLGVLTLDDMAVGQLDVHASDEVVDLLELHLVPGLQRHGLGATALGALLTEADAAGLAVRLHVETGSPARRLYERHGFVTTTTGPVHIAMVRPAAGSAEAGGAARDPGPPAGGAGRAPAPDGPDGVAALPTYDDLAPHLGALVACGDDGLQLELTEVRSLPGRTPAGRVPYSAILEGPLDRPLAQGNHVLDLPGCDPLALFLVPLEPESGRARYELLVG